MQKNRKELYQYIIDNLSDAVYIYQPSTNKFLSINPAGEKLIGYKKREFFKLPLQKIIAPESVALVKKMITEKTKKDVSTIYEIEIIRKDGTRVPVEISSRATYEAGKPVEILGIARDISERKHIEKQKEIFLSLITHELKNPLTAVKMYTDLLERSEKNKTKLQYFSAINNQINAITMLMNDFLEVSKIRVGKFSIEKEQFDLDAVVKEAIETFKKGDYKHKISRRGRVLMQIMGDKNRIRQVLVNLISNAIKYSPDAEKVAVTVRESKIAVTVAIRDYGVGIAKEDSSKIFELFYRTAHAEKRNIKGHGLGLFICREIIKSHNGTIWVRSVPGGGSTFFFTLPIVKSAGKRVIV